MATEVVHTVGSGGDYADLAAWSAAQARNLVSANEIAVAEIVGTLTEPSYVPISTSAGWSTDSTRRIVIRAAAPFNGTLGAGSKLVLGSSSPYGMAFSAALHVSIENLEVEYTGTSRAVNGSVLRISGCFIYGSSITDPNVLLLCDSAELNSSVFQSSARGYDARNVTATVDNCGFFALSGLSTYGLLTDAGTTVRNTVSAGWRDADIYGTPGTDSNNATLDGSVGATISTATGVDFVDYGSGDYRPTATGALFKAGTNPLSPLSNPDDWKDITGKTRAYWDIGAFAAPASLAENTHLATFTTRPTDTGASGGPNVAGTETNYPGYIDLSKAPQALWDAVAEKVRTWDFDGADGAYTPTGFDTVNGSWEINGNRLRRAGTGLDELLVDVGANDCTITATARCVSGGTNDRASLFFRYGDGDNTWLLYIDEGSNAFTLTKKVSGTWAPSPVKNSTESIALDTDYELKVIISGDTIKCYLDGAYVFETTDSDLSQYTYAGFREASGGLEYANFAASRNDGIVGGDIRVFENQAGGLVELPAEVVSCDTSAETGELHYLLPSISASTPQEIRLYADGVSSRYDHADPFGRNAVWGDYAAVYHGNDLTDATGRGGNLTSVGAGSAVSGFTGSGQIGESFNIAGTGGFETSTAGGSLSSGGASTLQAWLYQDVQTGSTDYDQAVLAYSNAAESDGHYLALGRVGSLNNKLFTFTSGGNTQSTTSGTAVSTNLWALAHSVFDQSANTVTHYLDGGQDSTAASYTDNSAAGAVVRIGIRGDYANGFHGKLSEVRVRDTALSPQWIPAEYNQSDPSLFYTATDPNAGGSESISPDSLYQSVSIEGVTLTQAHVLAAANLAQLQAIGAATLAQANSIAPHGVDQTAGIESATLTQAHIIAPAGISQHQQIGTASLVSAGVLSVIGLAQTQTLDEAILTVAGALDVDGVSQSQVLEALTLVQNNILAPAGLAQEAALEATTINAAALGITPAGIEQVMAIGPTGLTQYHVLAVSDLAQDQILEAARFGGLVIGELAGKVVVYAALNSKIAILPALSGDVYSVKP
jgi:hypothetical protein